MATAFFLSSSLLSFPLPSPPLLYFSSLKHLLQRDVPEKRPHVELTSHIPHSHLHSP